MMKNTGPMISAVLAIIILVGCTTTYRVHVATDPPAEMDVFIDDEYKGRTSSNGEAEVVSGKISIFHFPLLELRSDGYRSYRSLSYAPLNERPVYIQEKGVLSWNRQKSAFGGVKYGIRFRPEPTLEEEKKIFMKTSRIRLSIEKVECRESSWDLEQVIREKISKVGLEPVLIDAENFDATLKIVYTEQPSGRYTRSGVPGPEDQVKYGYYLKLFITLHHAQLGKNLFEKDVSGSTGSIVLDGNYYRSAVEDLNRRLDFKYLGEWVAASLYKPIDTSELITELTSADPHTRKAAVQLLSLANWTPESVEEKAIWAVGQEQWEECVLIGYPAVEPLITLVGHYRWSANHKVYWALGEIGDERAVLPLIEELNKGKSDEELIIALGKLGDNRALEPLSKLITHAESQKHLDHRRNTELVRKIKVANEAINKIQIFVDKRNPK